MSEFEQIGNFQLPPAELLPLLKRYQLLPGIVRELTIDRAIIDIECSNDEQIVALKQFYDREHLTTEDRLQYWLNCHYLDRQQLAEIAIRQFKIEKFKQATWGDRINAHFLKRKGQLDRIVYSLIRTKELEIAQEIYFRSIAGEQSFTELATKYSEGAESQTGGLIGPVEISVPHPAIAQAISTHPLGQVCQPMRLEEWYVIVRPEKIIPARLDELMRQRMLDELFQIWLQEEGRVGSKESGVRSKE